MFGLQNPEKIIFVPMTWQSVTERSLDLSPNTGYRIDREGTPASLRLPESAPLNSEIKIDGQTGGWKLIQRDGQQIVFGNLTSIAGAAGGMRSTDPSDYAELLYLGEGKWKVRSAIGNFDLF